MGWRAGTAPALSPHLPRRGVLNPALARRNRRQPCPCAFWYEFCRSSYARTDAWWSILQLHSAWARGIRQSCHHWSCRKNPSGGLCRSRELIWPQPTFPSCRTRQWDKIHVVHCGLEPTFFEGEPSYPSTRNLICVGRLCEQKGQLLLIEAARRLDEAGVDFTLTLAGDGELREELEALITQYGLGSRIEITGWITSEEVRQRLLDARALVLPSFAEGLPVVIMEAMALRRPVISTYVAGIPELVHDGEHGWLVPAGDVYALVSAMKRCLEAPFGNLQSMGDAARHRVIRRHHVDRAALKLIELLNTTQRK